MKSLIFFIALIMAAPAFANTISVNCTIQHTIDDEQVEKVANTFFFNTNSKKIHTFSTGATILGERNSKYSDGFKITILNSLETISAKSISVGSIVELSIGANTYQALCYKQ